MRKTKRKPTFAREMTGTLRSQRLLTSELQIGAKLTINIVI